MSENENERILISSSLRGSRVRNIWSVAVNAVDGP